MRRSATVTDEPSPPRPPRGEAVETNADELWQVPGNQEQLSRFEYSVVTLECTGDLERQERIAGREPVPLPERGTRRGAARGRSSSKTPELVGLEHSGT